MCQIQSGKIENLFKNILKYLIIQKSAICLYYYFFILFYIMIRRFISTSRRILCDKTSTTNLEYYDNYKNTYEDHAKTFSHVDASGNATMVDVGM